MRDRVHNRFFLAGIGAAILLVTWSVSQAHPDPDDPVDQRLAKLNERLGAIEKVIGVNTAAGAEKSLTRRLETLEGALRNLVKAAGGVPGTSVRGDLAQLERTVRESEQEAKELGRRVQTLERALRDASSCSRELRELRRDLSNLRRTVDDLQRRMRRLEN